MTDRIDYAKASPDGFKAFGGVYAVSVARGPLSILWTSVEERGRRIVPLSEGIKARQV